jgi:hypothetical protein
MTDCTADRTADGTADLSALTFVCTLEPSPD